MTSAATVAPWDVSGFSSSTIRRSQSSQPVFGDASSLIFDEPSWSPVLTRLRLMTTGTAVRLISDEEFVANEVKRILSSYGDAVYLAHNHEDGVWEAYLFVEDHTDAVYENVIRAEDELASCSAAKPIEIRVRAHQNQPIELVAPRRARRVF